MALSTLRNRLWVLGAMGTVGLVSVAVYAWKVGDGPFSPNAIATGTLSVTLLAIWLGFDRQRLGRFLRGRGAQQSGTATLITLLAAGIAVSATVLAHKHDQRWDLTSTDRYALAPQTISVLEDVNEPVTIHAFFAGESIESMSFRDLIDGYQLHTSHITVEFHDPVLEPVMAKQFDITSTYGTLVLSQGDADQRVEGELGEEQLTNALIRLTSGREHTLCATDGHGELDPDDDSSPDAISAVVTKLEGQNYTFERINPLRAGGIPAQCELVLIADPQVDFLPAEREMLAAFLVKGGQVILLIDPGHAPGLAKDLERYGIEVGDDIVLESNPNYQLVGGDASYLILDAQVFADHPVTQAIKGMIIMRVARSVAETAPREGLAVTELIRTSEYAWAETDLLSAAAPQPDPESDRIGRIPVVTLSEITDPSVVEVGGQTLGGGEDTGAESLPGAKAGGRLVVFGDSDFTSNGLLDQASNIDLLQNTIAWLTGEENQVSIRPNTAGSTLTMDGIQGMLVWLISVLIVPCLALGGAISTWLARRKL